MVALGGTLALHDVFAHPAEGGQVPYGILLPGAGHFGQWEEAGAVGSLRLLRRLATR